MANRPALVKRKAKVARVTRSEQYLVNVKYLGDEPDASKFKKLSDTLKAFNWYNNMCTVADAREYLKDYLLNNKEIDRAKKIDKIPDNWIPMTAAWQARIAMNQKTVLDLEISEKITTAVDKAISHIKVEQKTEKQKADKPSIQDRIKERLYDIIGDIEELIDSGVSFSLYDWLKKNEIPAMYATKISEYYGPIWNEMVQAHAGKLDGYEKWTKAQLKARIEFYNQIVSDAEKYGSVTKKVQAVRKPRPVSVEKLLKSFKYQKESNELKLASVNPDKIIGAKELWTYHTKYNIITLFKADGPKGLGVNGTTITGFNEKESTSLRCGRKPEEVLEKFMKGGKVAIKKLIEELKSLEVQKRSNENTILLKVV